MAIRLSKWRGLVAGAVLACGAADAAELIIGPTFPIAEPDTAAELRDKASKADWQAWMRHDPHQYAAFNSVALPRATQTRVRTFDPTYTLPRDLLDGNGRVVYPAGFKFNIYDRLHTTIRYIVIGTSAEDYQWLETVAKPQPGDKVLIAGGNILDERDKHKQQLFLLDDRFIERFGLQVIPSIVQQQGNQLQISEFTIKAGKS